LSPLAGRERLARQIAGQSNPPEKDPKPATGNSQNSDVHTETGPPKFNQRLGGQVKSFVLQKQIQVMHPRGVEPPTC